MAIERRYQIFVSSTYDDLGEERREVMQALLELDAIPSGMELFPAANDDQWTLIKRVIDDCDYYLVIVGGRYGSIGPGGKSYTQMEYEYAVKKGKPVMAFLHKDPGSLSMKRTEKADENRQKLEAFRELVQQRMVKYWNNPIELGSVVSRSLIKLIRDNPAPGWVRGDQVMDDGAAQEILRLRKRIEDMEQGGTDASPEQLQTLAQGNDAFPVHFSFRAKDPERSYRFIQHTWSIPLTWNEIFAQISPLMIDQAPDTSLASSINSLIEQKASPPLKEMSAFADRPIDGFRLNEDDFRAIVVQLRALNLIQEQTKAKRGVHDRATYFRLTPAGDRQMVLLRAIRRAATPADPPRKRSAKRPRRGNA